MAGRFRGAVGKLSKPKTSRAARKSRGKRVVALVKRAPKLSEENLQKRIAELTGITSTTNNADGNNHPEQATSKKSREKAQRLSADTPKNKKDKQQRSVSAAGTAQKGVVIPMEKKRKREDNETQREGNTSTAAGVGLRLLHRAVRSQSHNRLLPHQNRHDYEYRLRTVATTGVVRLFNSLAQARKAAGAVETQEKHRTADKTLEKKQVATKEAFLAALRQPRAMDRY
ncbi:Ribosomal RNA-processing protein 15 [Trypanosoma melophagium]|uniref:Ribosomal RNA-processing protein 15 n=1 Tax=Trypanosoma melophagium TaxID=715481 RepID=UPI00351A18CF|nr:Ribosomal RNA-processing protein 15 [Trypanosoma melophagium]